MLVKSLFRRLSLSYLSITVVAVVLVAFYGWRMTRDLYLERTRESLETKARLCANQTLELLASGRPAAVDELCKKWGSSVDLRITVILPAGEVVGDTEADPQQMDDHSNRPEVIEAATKGVGRSTRFSDTLNNERMYVAVAVKQGNKLDHFVRTSVPVSALQEALGEIYHQIVIAGLVAAGLIAIVSLWFSLRITAAVGRQVSRSSGPETPDA
jgi:two-component system phosphate regulon sensor histidine kinase PhoR